MIFAGLSGISHNQEASRANRPNGSGRFSRGGREMKIALEPLDGNAAVMRLDGRLDAAAAPKVQKSLEEALAQGRAHLAVDLERVSFIDSTGLGTLVSGLKASRRAEGNLRLVAPGVQVRKLLRLTTLDRVFTVSETLEGA
jgi:anti-anti-sigma factor